MATLNERVDKALAAAKRGTEAKLKWFLDSLAGSNGQDKGFAL